MSDVIPIPTGADFERVEHQRLRRRILYDEHKNDLEQATKKEIGKVRREAWGDVDMTANVLQDRCNAEAVLYRREPVGSHDAADAAAPTLKAFSRANYWALMKRVQRDTIGMREMLVRLDATEAGQILARPVYPDMVEAVPDPDHPDRAIEVRELRKRTDPRTGRKLWTRDVLSIADPDFPVYQVLDASAPTDGEDLTELFLGQHYSGEAYPYRRTQGPLKGMPVLPYPVYHAEKTGQLFDWQTLRTLVEGTIRVGIMWTLFGHVIRNCSWPQKYGLGVEPLGLDEVDENADGKGRSSVVTDPATIALFRLVHDHQGQALLGQFQVGADPKLLQEAIAAYEHRVASHGRPGGAFTRKHADARSGYALGLDRESEREAQRAYEPTFRATDEQVLELGAILLNRATGSRLPEEDYRIAYTAIPKSADEAKAEQERLLQLVDRNLMDKVRAYQELNPGISAADAERELEEIARTNARFRAA